MIDAKDAKDATQVALDAYFTQLKERMSACIKSESAKGMSTATFYAKDLREAGHATDILQAHGFATQVTEPLDQRDLPSIKICW